jgi:hypothetical protein
MKFFPLFLSFYLNASFLYKIMNSDLHLLDKVPDYYYIFKEQISRFFVENYDTRIPLFDYQLSRKDDTVYITLLEEVRASIFVE